MSAAFWAGLVTALWLGILTSLSPCPMAANLAAVSFVGKRVGSPRRVLWAGGLYTLGRMMSYAVLGVLLVQSLLSAPQLSYFLQKYMNRALGPVLIFAGLVLLEIIRFRMKGSGVGEKMQKRVEAMGLGGAFLMGAVFALSFCPVSAALFFGSLLPLCLEARSGLMLPSVYGFGTGLPVLLFAFLLALGAGWVGKAFDKLTAFEKWARRVTGAIFVLVGIYYILNYWFGINLLL